MSTCSARTPEIARSRSPDVGARCESVLPAVAVPVRVHDDRELCEEVELQRPGRRERAAAVVSEQCELGRRCVLPDHGEVTITVAVEVGRGDPVGPGADRIHGLRPEGAVAVVEQHAHVAGLPPEVREGEVEVAVTVEVGERQPRRAVASQVGGSREGAVPVVEVEVDDVVGEVATLADHHQVGIPVPVEVTDGDVVGLRLRRVAHRRAKRPVAQVELHLHPVLDEILSGPGRVGVAVAVQIGRDDRFEEATRLVPGPGLEDPRVARLGRRGTNRAPRPWSCNARARYDERSKDTDENCEHEPHLRWEIGYRASAGVSGSPNPPTGRC